MAGICPCTFGNSVSAALSNLRKAKRLNPDQPNETSPAVILSRRVVRRNEMFENDPWAYLVTFHLEKGDELELQTDEKTYGSLTEGTSGTLTWQDGQLLNFS